MSRGTVPGAMDWRHLADADEAARLRCLARQDAASLTRRALAATKAAAEGELHADTRTRLTSAYAALRDAFDVLAEVAR
ncbi:MAG: hypothetical protein MUC71_03245 [Steroidobacteraceae bacterium]|jgi:hypothetical protein|nr:hypothetical protein [Steroidobacteraceae bacterium]